MIYLIISHYMSPSLDRAHSIFLSKQPWFQPPLDPAVLSLRVGNRIGFARAQRGKPKLPKPSDPFGFQRIRNGNQTQSKIELIESIGMYRAWYICNR